MKTLYLYVPANMIDEYVKYGIKLSEHANKVLNIKKSDKKGITAYAINEVLAIYRISGKSLSSNKFKALKRTWKMLLKKAL